LSTRPLSLVWFKKDLRVCDHRPLLEACQIGQTAAVYILEPEWIKSFEFESGQFLFLEKSLIDLKNDLRKLGIPLIIRYGSAITVFSELIKKWPFSFVFSHEETGVDWTFKRDLMMKSWFQSQSVQFTEYPQFGVKRGLKNRDHWLKHRNRILNRALHPEINQVWDSGQPAWTLIKKLELGHLPSLQDLGLPPSEKIFALKGGRTEAVKTLHSFFDSRGQNYFSSLSSPVTAFDGCSRISPYLSWGNLSITEVLSELENKRQSVIGTAREKKWTQNLSQFESRLWWHCHFIQKLESEPEIEFENVNRMFDGLRESEFEQKKFQAWCDGQTGFPIIDACMRALKQHGWINFRMRAMLMSFASYQLWLDWRPTARFLAKHFLDFEPGIHFSQAQMQSGVTGINAIRIYSPQKQTLDRDPNGEFVRKYCPELAKLDTCDLIAPHLTPPFVAASLDFKIGRDYPEPIVDPELSYHQAKEKIFLWHKKASVQAEAKKVLLKHGSRKARHFPTQKRPI